MPTPDTNPIRNGWGDRLAAARNAAGLTQQQVADAVGVDRKTVQRWEASGVAWARRPDYAQQEALAAALGTPLTDLFPRSVREAELESIAADHDDLLARIGGGCS